MTGEGAEESQRCSGSDCGGSDGEYEPGKRADAEGAGGGPDGDRIV